MPSWRATCYEDGSWGVCVGETVPAVEDCATPIDESCSGAIAPCGATTTWSKRFGDDSENVPVKTVALDDAANIFIAGTFAGTIDLGAGPLTSSGPSDLFAGKFAPDGALIWGKQVA